MLGGSRKTRTSFAPSFVFISTMDSVPWGGSEELWSRAALKLVSKGFFVAASVVEWTPLDHRVQRLKDAGVIVSTRKQHPSLWQRGLAKLTRAQNGAVTISIRNLIGRLRPSIVVHSSGTAFPYPDFLEVCLSHEIPFVTIGQCNHEGWWLHDDVAARLRPAMLRARRCYFVSEANRRLAEKQLGCEMPNAEVIRNPFNVSYDAAPPWPSLGQSEKIQFASVGRLHPPSKGQDLLFEALAMPHWRERAWQLRVYGDGPMRDTLGRFAQRLGIADRVNFALHVADIEAIWAANHVLVMPSRFEGLPLTIIEAMLCARPVIATNVAGHSEVIEHGVTGFLAEAPTVKAMSDALEQFWTRRGEAESMGKAAANRVRQLVPRDPAQEFSENLEKLIRSPH